MLRRETLGARTVHRDPMVGGTTYGDGLRKRLHGERPAASEETAKRTCLRHAPRPTWPRT
jgi:hypothetical protein